MSGNGIRCFAQALARRRGDHLPQRILTDAGERLVTLYRHRGSRCDRRHRRHGARRCRSTSPRDWHRIGTDPLRPVSHLSVGNPHAVVGVDDVTVVDLLTLGAMVPDINLEIVEPGPEPHAITMRVHERGAGITEACGTGACASAWAAQCVGSRPRRTRRNHRAHGWRRCKGTSAPSRRRACHPGRSSSLHRFDHGSSLKAGAARRAMSTPYNEALGATLIERTKREQIVLVGVTLPGQHRRRHRGQPRRAGAADRHRRRRRGRPAGAAPRPPRPHVVHRQGQGRRAEGHVPGGRRRHGRVRQRAQPRRSSTTSRRCSVARRSTAPP